jgi:hypothetical protein
MRTGQKLVLGRRPGLYLRLGGRVRHVGVLQTHTAIIRSVSSLSDPDPDWIRIQSSHLIRIRIRIRNPDPGGQKLPTKEEKKLEISCF